MMNLKTYLLFVVTMMVFFVGVILYTQSEQEELIRELPGEMMENTRDDLREHIGDLADLDTLKNRIPTIRKKKSDPTWKPGTSPKARRDGSPGTPPSANKDQAEGGDFIDAAENTAADIFRVFSDVADGVVGMTPEEENEWGLRMHKSIMKSHRQVRDPAVTRRVVNLMKPFLKYTEQNHLDYQVYVLETNVFNAVTTVGGYIYVYNGLLKECEGNDNALKFILGHEIAHNELRHCAKSTLPLVRGHDLGGDMGASVASMANNLIEAGYSEINELEADEWSYRIMRDMGHSKEAALAGTRLLVKHTGAKPGNKKQSNRLMDSVNSWFSTHPDSLDRLEYLQSLPE